MVSIQYPFQSGINYQGNICYRSSKSISTQLLKVVFCLILEKIYSLGLIADGGSLLTHLQELYPAVLSSRNGSKLKMNHMSV